MSAEKNLPRLYREKEVSKILERATELGMARSGDSTSGMLSMEELEEIALAAGIDPADVRRAAMDLDSGQLGRDGWTRVVGEQLTLVRETVVEGQVSPERFELIIAAIRQAVGEFGQASVLGRTLTWQAETPSKTRSTMIVVMPQGEDTNIRIEERLHQLAGAIFGGGMGGFGGGFGIGGGAAIASVVGSVFLGFAIPVAAIGVAYLGGRVIYRGVARRRRRAMDEIMERIVRAVRSTPSLEGGQQRLLSEGDL